MAWVPTQRVEWGAQTPRTPAGGRRGAGAGGLMTGLSTSEHSRLGEGWGWSRGGRQQAGDPHPNVLGAGPCHTCRSTWLPEKIHPMLSTTPHKRVGIRAGQGLPSPPAKPGRPRRGACSVLFPLLGAVPPLCPLTFPPASLCWKQAGSVKRENREPWAWSWPMIPSSDFGLPICTVGTVAKTPRPERARLTVKPDGCVSVPPFVRLRSVRGQGPHPLTRAT